MSLCLKRIKGAAKDRHPSTWLLYRGVSGYHAGQNTAQTGVSPPVFPLATAVVVSQQPRFTPTR